MKPRLRLQVSTERSPVSSLLVPLILVARATIELVGFRFCKSVIRYGQSRFIFWLYIWRFIDIADLLSLVFCNRIKKKIVYCLKVYITREIKESKFIQPMNLDANPLPERPSFSRS